MSQLLNTCRASHQHAQQRAWAWNLTNSLSPRRKETEREIFSAIDDLENLAEGGWLRQVQNFLLPWRKQGFFFFDMSWNNNNRFDSCCVYPKQSLALVCFVQPLCEEYAGTRLSGLLIFIFTIVIFRTCNIILICCFLFLCSLSIVNHYVGLSKGWMSCHHFLVIRPITKSRPLLQILLTLRKMPNLGIWVKLDQILLMNYDDASANSVKTLPSSSLI